MQEKIYTKAELYDRIEQERQMAELHLRVEQDKHMTTVKLLVETMSDLREDKAKLAEELKQAQKDIRNLEALLLRDKLSAVRSKTPVAVETTAKEEELPSFDEIIKTIKALPTYKKKAR